MHTTEGANGTDRIDPGGANGDLATLPNRAVAAIHQSDAPAVARPGAPAGGVDRRACPGRADAVGPKGTDFKPITQARLDAVAAELNGRPRQTLGWEPPSEKFAEAVALTR